LPTAGTVDAGSTDGLTDPSINFTQGGFTVSISFDVDGSDDVSNLMGTINGNPVTLDSGLWDPGFGSGYIDIDTRDGDFVGGGSDYVHHLVIPEPST
jgi:hypothetical protein